MANRINFAARNVITPLEPGFKIDEIVLPYLTFVELYSYHIINILVKLRGISEAEANKKVQLAKSKYDESIYKICKEIINKTKGGCKILLNRNPSISNGSFLCLRIVDIKEDPLDLTASIHNCILALLGADYDGDGVRRLSMKCL